MLNLLLNLSGRPISPSAMSFRSQVSTPITTWGLVESIRCWNSAFLLTTDWQFTTKPLSDLMPILCLLFGVGHSLFGEEAARGLPTDEGTVRPLVSRTENGFDVLVVRLLNSAVLKFGIPQLMQFQEIS